MEYQNNSKKRTIFIFIFSIVFLAFFSVLYYGLFYSSNPREIPSALINQKAPAFQLITLDDQVIELKNYLGKPVILNFWASWCLACQEESRILEAIHREYKNYGVTVIGIAINDTKKNAEKFAHQYGKTYLLALDEENGEVALNYGIVGVPETFYIDKNGIIRKKILGVVQSSSVKEFLNTWLQ